MDSLLTPDKKQGRFIGVLADGKFHETVDKSTEGAVLREYETSKGDKGEKWELVYSKIEGTIANIEFQDGDFGEQVLVTFTDGEHEVILAFGVGSTFGEDFLKKLPNVDFAAKVKLVPYSFEDDSGKTRKGITVYQNDEKIQGYFYDAEKKEAINGYPVPEGDTEKFDKDDWKIFYLKARKFLVGYAKEHIVPQFKDRVQPEASKNDFDVASDPFKDPDETIDPESIPF